MAQWIRQQKFRSLFEFYQKENLNLKTFKKSMNVDSNVYWEVDYCILFNQLNRNYDDLKHYLHAFQNTPNFCNLIKKFPWAEKLNFSEYVKYFLDEITKLKKQKNIHNRFFVVNQHFLKIINKTNHAIQKILLKKLSTKYQIGLPYFFYETLDEQDLWIEILLNKENNKRMLCQKNWGMNIVNNIYKEDMDHECKVFIKAYRRFNQVNKNLKVQIKQENEKWETVKIYWFLNFSVANDILKHAYEAVQKIRILNENIYTKDFYNFCYEILQTQLEIEIVRMKKRYLQEKVFVKSIYLSKIEESVEYLFIKYNINDYLESDEETALKAELSISNYKLSKNYKS